jgi:site-specific recombinase XerD
MSDKPVSDLRRRLLQDMTNRNFGAKTQYDYIRHIETFAKFLGRAPDTATGDDIRRFQAEQIAQGAQPPKMNTQASALRFFFGITCGRADLAHQIARTHYPRKLPRVLSPEDVARLLEAAPGPGLKYKAALSVAYGAGLRGGEVAMLRVGDIDSQRMLIRVEMGKGRKDRHAMLSPELSCRWRCALYHDDARRRRVHPPLPSSRAAEGAASHPSLRPVRQRRTRRQHRARTQADRRHPGRDRERCGGTDA